MLSWETNKRFTLEYPSTRPKILSKWALATDYFCFFNDFGETKIIDSQISYYDEARNACQPSFVFFVLCLQVCMYIRTYLNVYNFVTSLLLFFSFLPMFTRNVTSLYFYIKRNFFFVHSNEILFPKYIPRCHLIFPRNLLRVYHV